MERINQLENQHLQAKDVHMNNHLAQNVEKTRI